MTDLWMVRIDRPMRQAESEALLALLPQERRNRLHGHALEKQPEAPTNPTEPASAPDEPQEPTPAQTAPSEATATVPSAEPEKDPATLDKIRDLARSLIVAGKRAGVQAAIKATGAASVSKLPPDSYTSVWEELLKLKDEVDANASN